MLFGKSGGGDDYELIVLLLLLLAVSHRSVSTANAETDCWKGPDYWCFNRSSEDQCSFATKSIGVCAYSNRRCPVRTGEEFCRASSPSALQFNGGLTGVDDGLFFYYMLSLYWPPSSCPSIYNKTLDFRRYFCSPYTDRGQPGSERLVLHGLWPTFSTEGNYQGWPQFCTGERNDWSKCHVNGNLCPWANASKADFTQDDYEYCLAVEDVSTCLVNASEVLLPHQEQLKIFAPGYLNDRNLFINHEWTKHGSCCSSTFGNNISQYLTEVLTLVSIVTRPGSLTDQHIQRHVGEKVPLDDLVRAFDQLALISCNAKCELDELWMCVERIPSTGLPGGLIECPTGAQNASDSCRKFRCEFVYIRPRVLPAEVEPDNHLFTSLYILIFLKFIFVFCGLIYSSFFPSNTNKLVA